MGSLVGENIAPIDDVRENSPTEKIRARYYVCDNAVDGKEAELFLDMLGLIEPRYPAADKNEVRRADNRARNKRRRGVGTDERAL